MSWEHFAISISIQLIISTFEVQKIRSRPEYSSINTITNASWDCEWTYDYFLFPSSIAFVVNSYNFGGCLELISIGDLLIHFIYLSYFMDGCKSILIQWASMSHFLNFSFDLIWFFRVSWKSRTFFLFSDFSGSKSKITKISTEKRKFHSVLLPIFFLPITFWRASPSEWVTPGVTVSVSEWVSEWGSVFLRA